MENVFALIAATLVLVAIPGPNVAVIVAGSLQHGRRFGLATVAGTTLGVGAQLLLVVAGYAALLTAIAGALTWVKWLGVAVLVVIGVRALLARPAATEPRVPPLATAFRRGLLLATVNPKTLLFNAAFLPQFVESSALAATQLPLLAAVYLFVVAAGDAGWAFAAGAARPWLARYAHMHQRLSGAVLVAAGGVLAAARAD